MGIKDDFFTYRTSLKILQKNIEVLKNLLNQKVVSLNEDDLKNRYRNLFVNFTQSMEKKRDEISKKSLADSWKWTIEYGCNFMSQIIRELHNYLIEESIPSGKQGFMLEFNKWIYFAHIELLRQMEGEKVRTVGQALSLANGYFNSVSQDRKVPQKCFFRGETEIGYPLLSRMGRKFQREGLSAEFSKVTVEEIEDLDRFKEWFKKNESLIHPEDQEKYKNISNVSPEWWQLMQHYDQDDGTRLLDITSSLFIGLYFACVSWRGEVDDTVDGILYLLSDSILGARFMVKNKEDHFITYDSEVVDIIPNTDKDFFTVKYKVPRIYLPEATNERQKFQAGAFLWWPEFNNPLQGGGIPYLHIDGRSKKHILRELWSYGITPAKVITGDQGLEVAKKLYEILF